MKVKNILVLILLSIVSFNCAKTDKKQEEEIATYQCPMKCEGDKVYQEEGSCPVCNMDVKPIVEKVEVSHNPDKISETSIFNLTTKWNTEEGKSIELKDLKGKTLVMVMIYTTCKAACPRLVADMRNIEAQIPKKYINNINFVLVSIDPETDTPKRLKEFANVLAVKYKEISPLDFSHSNIISVFNSGGELMHQQEGLGVDNKETIKTIIELQSK